MSRNSVGGHREEIRRFLCYNFLSLSFGVEPNDFVTQYVESGLTKGYLPLVTN